MSEILNEAARPGLTGKQSIDDIGVQSCVMAGRLLDLLTQVYVVAGEDPLSDSLCFLEHRSQLILGMESPVSERSPWQTLVREINLSPLEQDLIVLAGCPEEHEGFANLFRLLHPRHLPAPTLGLAAQLLCSSEPERIALRETIETGPAVRSGALQVEPGETFFDRSLRVANCLWSVLHGIDAWPSGVGQLNCRAFDCGLDEWFGQAAAQHALTLLNTGARCLVLVTAETVQVAWERAAAMVRRAGRRGVWLSAGSNLSEQMPQLVPHVVARDAVPVLRVAGRDQHVSESGTGKSDIGNLGTGERLGSWPTYGGPIVVCCGAGESAVPQQRPLVEVRCEPLSLAACEQIWTETVPALAAYARALAARFPVEPFFAKQIADDLRLLAEHRQQSIRVEDVRDCIRARTSMQLSSGVQRIQPFAEWNSLVLPASRKRRLMDAVERLQTQSKVLREWGFLAGRQGARGVRMLLSGPPGTGKTLAAEVVARELQVDLLVIDLSQILSKWVGESEKRLAEVLESAERTRAVLLFDEADAIFGKRTEISDAQDRYANLESAYLLTRIERFEGLAILSTNLRHNIDAAFLRRMEFAISFDEPAAAERLALWKTHLPDTAPLDTDVNLEELANVFPVVGAVVRNASVAAAFRAAARGTPLSQQDFIDALACEYEKLGKPFPQVSSHSER